MFNYIYDKLPEQRNYRDRLGRSYLHLVFEYDFMEAINEKKISIETKISTNLYENHFPNNKTSKNSQYNTNIIPSSRGKNNVTSKKHSALRIINNKNSFNNKIIINETITNNNYNINKLNHKIKQPNSGNKFYTSKKYVNKNQ